MVDVADLKAKIEIDDNAAASVLEKLDKKLEQIGDSILEMDENMQDLAKRGAESMGFLAHSMAYALGGFAKDALNWVVDSLEQAWTNAKELAQNLDKLHFGTGMDILSLQRMRAVLEQNGVSFEEFLGSLGRVQDMMARMRQNRLSQEEVFALGRLGINPREYKSAESLLNAIGNSLNRIGDIGERNFLASKLKISSETLRGLTVSGWYDEFAALTEKEKSTMAEYARLSKALDQEKSAIFTKFVSKFITKDGIEIEKTLLKISGAIAESIDKANNLGEVFDGLHGKIGQFFEYDPSDSALMKAFKLMGRVLVGTTELLTGNDDQWGGRQNAGLLGELVGRGMALLQPETPAGTQNITTSSYNDNKQANITVYNTGTFDGDSVKQCLSGAGFGSISILQGGEQ